MEIKPKETLRELFTTSLCLDISIFTPSNPPRARTAPVRYIDESARNEFASPPSKRVLSSQPLDILSPTSNFSPASERLLESFSPATRAHLKIDFIKDDKKIEKITGNSELDDPNYINFNTNPKIGTDLELWVCVNIPCPGCGKKLYKYSSPGMPAIDVKCNNDKHTIEHGPKYYQIKATESGKKWKGLEYFNLKDKYICTGSYRFGYNCHVMTSTDKDKDILIGYICLAYTKSTTGEHIILNTTESFILKPNLLFKPKNTEEASWTYYTYLDRTHPRITFNLEMFEVIKLSANININTNIVYDAEKIRSNEPPPAPAFMMKYLIMKMKYLNLKNKNKL
jgi:hypothetical protein